MSRARDAGDVSVNILLSLATSVAYIAADGVRIRQGRSGTFLSGEDMRAREAALAEAPKRFERYLAEAMAAGRPNPRNWARQEMAKAVQEKMRELGVSNAPAVDTIAHWKLL
jgi:hypothetical protein